MCCLWSTISKCLACYIHQQILDDLAAEDKAVLDARKEILWKGYLIKKLNDKMGIEVEKVANTELDLT
jgi:hypothetical protein